jgi:Tol biopolymer transport system component
VKLRRPVALVLILAVAGCAGPTVTPAPPASAPASVSSGPPPTLSLTPPALPSRLVHDGNAPVSTGEPIDLGDLSGRIVFDDFEDVFAMNVDGSNVVTVAGDPAGSEFDGAWSPDGEWIVYRDSTRGINENDEIFVARADGSERRNITNHPANDWGPDWSPDGSRIVFNSDRDGGLLRGYLVKPDGSNLRAIDVDAWFEYPSFSPDGSKVVFEGHEAFDYDVYVADLASGAVTPLTDNAVQDGWPVWSPDGATIAFTSVRDDCAFVPAAQECWRGDEVGEHRDTWLMNADGSNQRRVTPEGGQFVAWSPDGKYLLISGHALYVVRPDGTGRLELRADGITLPLGGIPDWH